MLSREEDTLPTTPKYSFCTTCMGRLSHLKQTLPDNLRATADRADVQFVVLAYGDLEVLHWARKAYPEEIQSGKLKLAYIDKPVFNMTHAKNIAHKLGNGEILCNVDADNRVTKEFVEYLDRVFATDKKVFVRRKRQTAHAIQDGGLGGRIALRREDFIRYHGYKESLQGWVNDDSDLKERLVADGFENIDIPRHLFGDVIQHSDAERVANVDHRVKEASASRLENISALTTSTEPANPDGNYGMGTVITIDNYGVDIFPLRRTAMAETVISKRSSTPSGRGARS